MHQLLFQSGHFRHSVFTPIGQSLFSTCTHADPRQLPYSHRDNSQCSQGHLSISLSFLTLGPPGPSWQCFPNIIHTGPLTDKKFLGASLFSLHGWTFSFSRWNQRQQAHNLCLIEKGNVLDWMWEHNVFVMSQSGMIFLGQSGVESFSLSQPRDCLKTPRDGFLCLPVKYKAHHWP